MIYAIEDRGQRGRASQQIRLDLVKKGRPDRHCAESLGKSRKSVSPPPAHHFQNGSTASAKT